MPRYALRFDLDHTALVAAGYTDPQIYNQIFTGEALTALAHCGFIRHPDGSVFHTKSMDEDDSLIVRLQRELQGQAPTFCRYVRSISLCSGAGVWRDISQQIQNGGLPGIIAPRGRDPEPDPFPEL